MAFVLENGGGGGVDGVFDTTVEPVSPFALEGEPRFPRDIPIPLPAPVSPAPTPAPIFTAPEEPSPSPVDEITNSIATLLAPILGGGAAGGGVGRPLPFGTAGTRLVAGEQRRSPLLAILILVAIGGIGYFVYRRYRRGRES